MMRREVFRCYRLLLRTCRSVFQNDQEALQASRRRVRDEFWKNRLVTDREQISKLILQAQEAEQFLRQNVVQAVHTGDNVYRVRMTKNTALEDNWPLPESTKLEGR